MMKIVAANTKAGKAAPEPADAIAAPAIASVATITAIPAPCGVGTRCEDRAFGFASAWRSSSGLIAQIVHADNMAARTMAESESGNSGTVISL